MLTLLKNHMAKIGYLGLSLFSLLFAVRPVWQSTYAGDDWPNSQTPDLIRWRYGTNNFLNWWSETAFWNEQWFIGQGRIYSIQFLENRLIFSTLQTERQYKFLQTFLIFLVGILIAYVIYLATKNLILASTSIALYAAILQIRLDFDPHLAFGGMLQSMILKILLTLIISYHYIRKPSKIKGFFMVFIWIAALQTYEYSWLTLPGVIFFLLAIIKQSKIDLVGKALRSFKVVLASLSIPLILFAISVFGYLKPKAIGVSEAYKFSFSYPESVKIYLQQTYASLPGSVDRILFIPVDFGNKEISFRAIFIIIALLVHVIMIFFQGKTEISNLAKIYILLSGVLLFLSPGLVLAGQPVWWELFNWGNSYLGVFVGEVGLVLILVMLYQLASDLIRYLLKDQHV